MLAALPVVLSGAVALAAPIARWDAGAGGFIDDGYALRDDGKAIAFITTDGATKATLHLVDVGGATAKPETTIEGAPIDATAIYWLGPGRVLVARSPDGHGGADDGAGLHGGGRRAGHPRTVRPARVGEGRRQARHRDLHARREERSRARARRLFRRQPAAAEEAQLARGQRRADSPGIAGGEAAVVERRLHGHRRLRAPANTTRRTTSAAPIARSSSTPSRARCSKRKRSKT